MSDDYIDAKEEYVKISRENYDRIKDGYDEGYQNASDETLAVIEDLEAKNEKLQSAICVVHIGPIEHELKINPLTFEYEKVNPYRDTKILNEKSELYVEVHKYFKSLDNRRVENFKLLDKIDKFRESRIGKFLNFFRIKI